MAEAWDIEALRPAIRALRTHLSDIEEHQIPQALKPVAASSAKKLPPPLAALAVRSLDESAALREAIAEADLGKGPHAAASRAFLNRGAGWEDEYRAAVEQMTERDAGRAVARLKHRVRTLERELAQARSKVKEVRARAEAEASELRAAAARRRPSDATHLESAMSRMRSELEEAAARTEELAEALARAEAERERLRAALLRARRARPVIEEGERWGLGTDPEGLARSLDRVAAIARVPASVVSADGPGDAGAWALPPGIRPDRAEAVGWLVDEPVPTTVIIDGYNVAWLLDPSSFSGSTARSDVVRRAVLLRSAAQGPLKPVVVFDSVEADEAGGEDAPPVRGVDVRWAPSADDEVRRLAAETEGRVVVVTTDREVQEGARSAGALVLWSEAFVEWSGHGSA